MLTVQTLPWKSAERRLKVIESLGQLSQRSFYNHSLPNRCSCSARKKLMTTEWNEGGIQTHRYEWIACSIPNGSYFHLMWPWILWRSKLQHLGWFLSRCSNAASRLVCFIFANVLQRQHQNKLLITHFHFCHLVHAPPAPLAASVVVVPPGDQRHVPVREALSVPFLDLLPALTTSSTTTFATPAFSRRAVSTVSLHVLAA